ncbi:MAG TPA: discoidin domain-containing protein [Gemmatimonadaceae bacterium]
MTSRRTYGRARARRLAALAAAALVGHAAAGRAQSRDGDTATVTIAVRAGSVAGPFDPRTTLGGGVDGHAAGDIGRLYTPANRRAMQSAGFGVLTYRLRTELGNDAWHWNPAGRWSEAPLARGYWTSDTAVGAPITRSFGYRLPRRGNTIDQADDDGYSRIDDGDARTFWKSDPYLAQSYTGDDDARHPQWVIIDLGHRATITAIRIQWGAPFATTYDVQYWAGDDPEDGIDGNPDGAWRTFPLGSVHSAAGGDDQRRLSHRAVHTRLLRLVLRAASHTGPPRTSDPRDALGYAIRELAVGVLMPNGAIADVVRHAADRTRQTVIYVSSTDPWHRAVDIDSTMAQPGLDQVFHSHLTNGRAPMLPVAALYDTPENAAAEIIYLRKRGYPLDRVEIGEEPDGQNVSPDDYGALYVQWARALAAADPAVHAGGPSWQSTSPDVMMAWREDPDARPWLTRFLDYLRVHQASASLTFFSFEWYPFDDVCAPTAPQLARATDLMTSAMANLGAQGLPANVPRVIAEYGYSAFAGTAEMGRAAALLDADAVANFLTLGGTQAFLYGWEPSPMDRNSRCDTWGDNTMFLSDTLRRIRYPTATYYAARMLTQDWLEPAGGPHRLYRAIVHASDASRRVPVTAYAALRPNGTWALLLVNTDPRHSWRVGVRLDEPRAGDAGPSVRASLVQLSASTYRWHSNGARGTPAPDTPPTRRTFIMSLGERVALPPYSVTVLRWPAASSIAAATGSGRLRAGP